jgi:predicted esterase
LAAITEKKLPLIIVLDPHGNGQLGVEKIKSAATQFPCFIASSDLVRNNYPLYMQAIAVMIDDIIRKYPVDKDRIFLAGFSGGARMAFGYAQQNPVKGVLMCSAGPGVNSVSQLPCPVYMISGTKDFNFAETWSNPASAESYSTFFSDYFRGIHEWPPAESLKTGLMFLLNTSLPFPVKLQKATSESLFEKADSLFNANDYLLAFKSVQKALLFDKKSKKAAGLLQKIKANPACTKQFREIENYLSLEYRLTQEYAKAMMQKDSVWWFNEMNVINDRIAGANGNEKDHLQRVKGFLGIVFFSQLSNLIASQPSNSQIVHILAAYRKIEPTNPDVYYYYALYNFKTGNTQKCRYFLELSRKSGFTDQVRFKRDFPSDLNN